MKFVITGAYRDTGGEVTLTVDADSQQQAEQIAYSKGIAISAIRHVPSPAAPPPLHPDSTMQAQTSGPAGPSTPGVSGLAIASLAASIPGVCCFPAGIIAIVLGLLAIREIKQPQSLKTGSGLAFSGIGLGVLSLLVLAVYVAVGPSHSETSASSRSTSSVAHRPTGQTVSAAPASQQQATAIPADVRYRITRTELVPRIKRNLEIQISRIVSEDVLREIALKIKAEDSRPYERTFMLYYLPDMTPGSGAWASTHFTPDLKVEIFGFTPAQAEKIVRPSSAEKDSIGRWVDNGAGAASQITIYRQSGKIFMLQAFKDGSELKRELNESPSPLGRRFDNPDSMEHGEYFVIAKNGDLEMRNSKGPFATIKPAK